MSVRSESKDGRNQPNVLDEGKAKPDSKELQTLPVPSDEAEKPSVDTTFSTKVMGTNESQANSEQPTEITKVDDGKNEKAVDENVVGVKFFGKDEPQSQSEQKTESTKPNDMKSEQTQDTGLAASVAQASVDYG